MTTGNATRWYATREAVKAAAGISGVAQDAVIDEKIEAGSADIEEFLLRAFIPETTERLYRWPPRIGGGTVLQIPQKDLIAVTQLQSKAQDTTPTTLTSFFVEPVNEGPPFSRIEIDLSGTDSFEAGDTAQRSIGVTGRWGYREDTVTAGALDEADDGSETELAVTNGAVVDMGNTILIGTEAYFVSNIVMKNTSTTFNDTATANKNDVSITLQNSAEVFDGEVIGWDSERMLVVSHQGTAVTVVRAVDGSVLATHSSGPQVQAVRQMTVVRAVNGTSAAAHDTATAIVKYMPPADIRGYVIAYAIFEMYQDSTGRTGVSGGDQGSVETKGFSVWAKKNALIEKYGIVTF